MQFFVYFSLTEGTPMNPPTPEGMAKMGKFMEESFDSGRIVSTGRLPRQSTHVKLEAGNFSISDGPFIEAKELIPRFYGNRGGLQSRSHRMDQTTSRMYG